MTCAHNHEAVIKFDEIKTRYADGYGENVELRAIDTFKDEAIYEGNPYRFPPRKYTSGRIYCKSVGISACEQQASELQPRDRVIGLAEARRNGLS